MVRVLILALPMRLYIVCRRRKLIVLSRLKSNRSFNQATRSVARSTVAATPAKTTRHRSTNFLHGGMAGAAVLFVCVLPLVEIRVARGAFQRVRLDVANRFLGVFQADGVPLVP